MLRWLPCTVGSLAATRRLHASRASACQEEQKASYYGVYAGDRFGGGIGQRVGVDESDKHALSGTGIVRVKHFSETHGRLREWATEANWKEATRIHKAVYFTRSENLVQEAVLERIRQHYVSCLESLDHHRVEAALFRLEDVGMFETRMNQKVLTRIPTVVFGKFDEKHESCVVDFASERLGGGWLSYGMVQEEKMFIERFDFGALCARSLLEMPGDPLKEPLAQPFSMMENEAWILRGAPIFAEIPWYGRTPNDGLARVQLLNPVEDLDTMPTVVAIDAIKADFPVYRREHLVMMVMKAYTGFVAAKHDPDVGGCSQIATGSWGCGAFYNNECVMFVIQTLAASLADVELTHHVLGDGFRLAPAFAFLEDALVRKLPVSEVLDSLVQICASDPGWQTKCRPPQRNAVVQKVAASKL